MAQAEHLHDKMKDDALYKGVLSSSELAVYAIGNVVKKAQAAERGNVAEDWYTGEASPIYAHILYGLAEIILDNFQIDIPFNR